MTISTRGRSRPLLLSFLLLLALLLAGCGRASGSLPKQGGGGPFATDGDVFATYGDAFATDGDAFATDGDALSLEQTVPFATDGNAQPIRTVTVSTLAGLLKAIAPDTCVVLQKGEYLLDPADANDLYDYCYWRSLGFEGGSELVLNVWNCVIMGESGDPADVRLIAEPRLANVLTLEGCSQVQLKNLTLGHTEGAICSGGVLNCSGGGGVYVENCDLYGCGTIGVNCESVSGVTVADSVIHDCSYMGISAMYSHSLLFDHCTFSRCGRSAVASIHSSSWCLFDHCDFTDNQSSVLLDHYQSCRTFFDFCAFTNGSHQQLYNIVRPVEPPEFKRCTFVNSEPSSGEAFTPDTTERSVIIDGKPWNA